MNTGRMSFSNAATARLRATVAAIEIEIARLREAATDDSRLANDLASSWNDLVEQLALGPEPEVRECPVCKHTGMRAATVCGYCWTKLTPPAERHERH